MRLTLQPSGSGERLGGWFARVAPTLVASVGSHRLRLEASYVGDYRASDPAGNVYVQELALRAALARLGPLSGELTLFGGRSDASHFAEDRLHLAGGEVAGRLALSSWLRALASYHVELRFPFDGVDRTKTLLQVALLRLPVSWTPAFEIGPFGDVLRLGALETNGPDAFSRWRGGVVGAVYLGRVSAALSGWTGSASGAGLEQRLLWGATGDARIRLGGWVDAFVSGELTRASHGPGPLDRGLVLLGLSAHASSKPRLEAPTVDDDLRPVVEPADATRPARARLRLLAPNAGVVSLLGSWDDWAEHHPLERKFRGLWEVWLPLPPGEHRYHFLVDGRLVSPPSATRYAADGFGGQDGVLEVLPPVPGKP